MSIVIANKLFNEKKYEEAYELYKELKAKYGGEILEANIKLCEKYLSLDLSRRDEVLHTHLSKSSYLNIYFDHIYVVNLKHKIADKLTIAQHLKEHGIGFEIFEATNGYEGAAYEKWESYKKRPLGVFNRYKHFSEKEIKLRRSLIESAGAIGYIYTYLRILTDAKSKGYKKFLILEDDVLLDERFEEKSIEFLSKVSTDWKVLLFGASQYGWRGIDEQQALQSGFYYPRRIDGNTTCGSFAIAFDYSVIDEMIEAASSFEAPFDHLPLGELYERHLNKCFVAYPNIIIADVGESTIRNKRSQIEHSKRVKWRLENFDYPSRKPSVSVILSSRKNVEYIKCFNNQKNLPFNIRMYYNSIDGLRPLHNASVLNHNHNKIITKTVYDIKSEADYVVTISESDQLSENDLINFIEFQTGVTNISNNKLVPLSCSQAKIVKDRATVIIPTYKRAENLQNAIESVLLQDYPDIELIIVSDNGEDSEHNSEVSKIVNKLNGSTNNCKIRLVSHKYNRNGSAARNTGILNSTGEFISFLDDDDVYLQGRLSKVIDKLKSCPNDIGAVYCGFLGWNSQMNNLGRYTEGDLTKEFLSLDYSRHYLHTNTATYRRQAVMSINGFDESYRRHQDLEFNLRFFEQYKISTYKEALVKLKPEPVKVNNKLFDSEMIELKTKFLSQFKYLIESFSEDVQFRIYDAHVQETVKYIKKTDEAIQYYIHKFQNFDTSLLISIIKDKYPSLRGEFDNGLLKKQYHKNEIGFYRIIGNNHSKLQSHEQTYLNLLKIIEEEEFFEDTDKYFVLNRITNYDLKTKLKSILDSRNLNYLEIDYDKEVYRKIGYDLKNLPNPEVWFKDFDVWNRLVMHAEIRESKNRYLINNNGARNFVLNQGKRKHKWIMPWDGNCFITKHEFKKIRNVLDHPGNVKYVLTPMERISDNNQVNRHSQISNAVEEPQITFRYDAIESFNEERVYGNQPKVELFKRLGVKGIWDDWIKLSPWVDLKFTKSEEAGLFKQSGATFRLSSGKTNAITKASQRNILRKQAIINYIDESEVVILRENFRIVDSSDGFPSGLKGFIGNLELRKKHNQLTWYSKSNKNVESESLLLELVNIFNNATDLDDKLYIASSLFSNSPKGEALKRVNLCNRTQLFISDKPEQVYKETDINDLNSYMSCLTSAFIANLYLLSTNRLLDSIRLKSEIAMLIYYYSLNIDQIGRDKRIYSIIYLVNYCYKKLYDYDLLKDLWLTGVNKNEVFI